MYASKEQSCFLLFVSCTSVYANFVFVCAKDSTLGVRFISIIVFML